MVNVRLAALFLSFGLCLISCSQFEERGRLPAAAGANCFEVGRALINEFQSEVKLAKAIKRSSPGQLTFGRPRVDYLRHRFSKWDFDEIQEYLDGRPIPYVEAPDGKWILHDRHHLFLALIKEKENLEARFPNQALTLTYQRKKSFKGKDWQAYRSYMESNNTILLRAKGQPINWEDVPRSFKDMDKDFFRGMAWVLIKSGLIEKEPRPFFEFTWADELRRKFPDLPRQWRLEHVEDVFEDIVDNPQKYRHLPGLVRDGPDLEEALLNIEKISTALSW